MANSRIMSPLMSNLTSSQQSPAGQTQANAPQMNVTPLQSPAAYMQPGAQGTPMIPMQGGQIQPSVQMPQGQLQLQGGQQGGALAQAGRPANGVPQMMKPAGQPGQPQQGQQPAAGPTADPQLAQDKITTALHDAVNSPEAGAMTDALSKAGINLTGGINSLSNAKDNIGNRTPSLDSIQNQGQHNAVVTGVNGGNYMDIASSMLGKSEGPDHTVLSQFFKKSMGQDVDPRSTPWCAAFANSVLQAGGVQGTNSLAARSFLKFGTSVAPSQAEKGDVIVFGRGNDGVHGHVGFVDHISSDGKTAYVLGGNQGKGTVSISARPLSGAIGIRRPPAAQEIQDHVQQKASDNQRSMQMSLNDNQTRMSQIQPRPQAPMNIAPRPQPMNPPTQAGPSNQPSLQPLLGGPSYG